MCANIKVCTYYITLFQNIPFNSIFKHMYVYVNDYIFFYCLLQLKHNKDMLGPQQQKLMVRDLPPSCIYELQHPEENAFCTFIVTFLGARAFSFSYNNFFQLYIHVFAIYTCMNKAG